MNNKITITRQGVYVDGQKLNRVVTRTCRHIYFHNNLVIKIDADPSEDDDSDYDPAFCQCYSEIEFWEHEVKDEDRIYFQPIIKHGKRWIAQERISFRTPTQDQWDVIHGIAYRYNIKDIEFDETTRKAKNWGVTQDGRPVIFDYAL